MNLSGTRWTLIHAAQEGDDAAIETLSAKYRPPVVAYLARRGVRNDAEDLAQEVFVRLLHDGVLARADSERGRFRSLVFAVTRNVLGHHLARETAEKRGAGKVAPLEVDVPLPEPDEAFDREWLNHLLETALGRLQREHPPYFDVLSLYLLDERPQAEIAERLGLSETNVRNRIHRGRRKLIAYLRDEVLHYSTSHADYGVELKALATLMGDPPA